MKNEPSDGRRPLDINIYELGVSITPHFVEVYGVLPDGEEVMIEFSPYQGIKITTHDCVSADPLPGWFVNADQLIEVANSAWLSELKLTLSENDHTADFLDQSKHFVLFTQDAEIEIIAGEYTIKKLKKGQGQ